MANIKIGDLLVKARVLQESHLRAALAEQKKWGGRLGDILVRMNLVSEEILVKALSKQLGIPAVNIETLKSLPPHVLAKVPVNTARDLHVVPLQLKDEGRTLVVAMDEPQNLESLDHLRAIAKARIIPQLAATSAITRAISRLYEGAVELDEAGDSFKVLNAQGETLHNAPAYRGETASPSPTAPELPTQKDSKTDALELLKGVEEVQRKEVAALKAMVELLIEKGVFTRDEYLAKVKR